MGSQSVVASCSTALLNMDKRVISPQQLTSWTNERFRTQELKAISNGHTPRWYWALEPSLNLDSWQLQQNALLSRAGWWSLSKVTLEALLHCIDSIRKRLGEEGGSWFSATREDDTAAIPGVTRSLVWSFVTAVRLNRTERLLSSSRTAGKVRSESRRRNQNRNVLNGSLGTSSQSRDSPS